MWDTNDGVYVGYSTDVTEAARPPPLGHERRYRDDRHILTIGPNGSGKSRRVLLPNLAELTGWSVVVVDPKGELAKMTLKHRKDAGNDIVVLDPFGVSGFESHGYNPIAALDPGTVDDPSDDFVDDCFALAEAMIRVEGKEPHWSASAQDLVCACIMAERLARGTGGNLGGVRQVLGLPRKKFKVSMIAMQWLSELFNCPELSVKAARFENKGRENDSIQSTALTQTRWLDSPRIKDDLNPKTDKPLFDFAQLKMKPTTVYLILPARRIATHNVWMRLIIASILQPLMKDTAKAEVPVMLMLDEYPALAEGDGFPAVSRNMAMFRGYGIKLWTVWQDLSQAARIYGREGWESFVANSGVLQSFAPQDVFTAEYLSKRMPLSERTSHSMNRSFKEGEAKDAGMSYSMDMAVEGMPLLLPQHLRDMDLGFSIVFSHAIKGVGRRYFPWEKKGLEHIYALDPAR